MGKKKERAGDKAPEKAQLKAQTKARVDAKADAAKSSSALIGRTAKDKDSKPALLNPSEPKSTAADTIAPHRSPGHLLWQVTNQWQRSLRAALDPLSLTHVQFVLLAGIAELQRLGGEVTQARLAARCQTDVMMTSQVVRALEKAGLVERRQHPTDRRARFLRLTEVGTERLENAVPVARDADASFFAALGKKQDKLLKHLVALNHLERD